MLANVVTCVISFVLAFVIAVVICNSISDLNVGLHQHHNRKQFNCITIYKWQHVCVCEVLFVERESKKVIFIMSKHFEQA